MCRLPEHCVLQAGTTRPTVGNSPRNVLVFISMPVVAFSVVNSVLTLASFIWLNRLLACVLFWSALPRSILFLTYGIIDRSAVANSSGYHAAETLCADDAANGADAGIKRRSGAAVICLLGQNPSGDAALT